MTSYFRRGDPVTPIIIPIETHDWNRTGQVDKFGRNKDVDGIEDIWSGGGMYVFLDSTAVTLYISSTQAADTMEMKIQGLDANFDEQEELISLSGTGQVEIGGTWKRVHRSYNDGPVATAGDIYIAETDATTSGVPDTASKIKAVVLATDQQTEMAIYTVPAGWTGYLMRWYASQILNRNSYAIMELSIREFGGVFRTQRVIGLNIEGNSHWDSRPPIAYGYPEKTDIKVRVDEVGAASQDISAGFDLLLVKNG